MRWLGERSPAFSKGAFMKKTKTKKLVLAKETLRSLEKVTGGEIGYTMSCGAVCYLSAPKYCPNQNTAGACTLP